MAARIKHLAIVSDQYAILGRFYQALFGLRVSDEDRPEGAVGLTDGYTGLNIGPRRPGRQGGFDHFGFEVDDVDAVLAKARTYPGVDYVRRPTTKAFAGITVNDPAGAVFDLSERPTGAGTAQTGQNGGAELTTRHVGHFVLKTLDPVTASRYYVDVFGLEEEARSDDAATVTLSDGQIRMVLSRWDITDYALSGVERPGLDHLGFAVESIDAVAKDVERLSARNAVVAPRSIGAGPEGQARANLLRQCQFGRFQLSDPDGVLLDVEETR